MAQDCYRAGHNRLGHVMSAAAAIPEGHRMEPKAFDRLMDMYRAWLVFGTYSDLQ